MLKMHSNGLKFLLKIVTQTHNPTYQNIIFTEFLFLKVILMHLIGQNYLTKMEVFVEMSGQILSIIIIMEQEYRKISKKLGNCVQPVKILEGNLKNRNCTKNQKGKNAWMKIMSLVIQNLDLHAPYVIVIYRA